MKKQTVLVSEDGERFTAECHALIRDGWRVIPGTVAVTSSASAVTVGHSENMGCQTFRSQSFVAFFEQTNELPSQ